MEGRPLRLLKGQSRLLQLSKRLAYILRYGAEKEGLVTFEGGYVDFMQLVNIPLLKCYKPEDIMMEIVNSTSYRGTARFQRKQENGATYVRAFYGRRFERNPNHENSKVHRLLEQCLQYVCNNINTFDLEDFTDEFLVNTIIHKLKQKKRLNNKTFSNILGINIEHLDLDGVYLTEKTLSLIGQRCPNLKLLSLHDCGYIITDHMMDILLKNLPNIESLNISCCRHLTDRTSSTIIKHLPNLQHLNASSLPLLTGRGILNLVINCPNLQHLDIFHQPNLTVCDKETIVEEALQRNITIIHSGLQKEGVTLII